MQLLLKLGSAAGAIVAILTVWVMLGLDRPAWTSDLKAISREQADTAVQLHQSNLRSLLSVQPPTDPVARQNWEELVRQTRNSLDAAVKRQVELSK